MGTAEGAEPSSAEVALGSESTGHFTFFFLLSHLCGGRCLRVEARKVVTTPGGSGAYGAKLQ